MNNILRSSINKLARDFLELNWSYNIQTVNKETVKVQNWLGNEDEDIMVCVLKDLPVSEDFHRQEYFFINYAYKNSYIAQSYKFGNEITINEDECYIGQPFSGYAIKTCTRNNSLPFIVGILIKKDFFYNEFLTVIAVEPDIFSFFVKTKTNEFSDEFLHFSFKKHNILKNILDLMIIEYANKSENTQHILKYYTAALLLQISKRYKELYPIITNTNLSDNILVYIAEHSENITLKDISKHFSYHPNYISALLKKETGKTFSEHLLDIRMNKALMLLKGTSLSIEKISRLVGYLDQSNFYKAFKTYYNKPPRKYIL